MFEVEMMRRRNGIKNLMGKSAAALLLFLACGIAVRAAEPGRGWAILITGVSGDPELQSAYLKELEDLRTVLETQLGFPRERITVLFDDPAKNPGLVQRKSTRAELQDVCRSLAGSVKKEDLVFVFIGGHGNFDGKTYKLNLVGPDPTADEVASMLYSIPAQRFVVINTTNCSGGSLAALSQKGKIVVTATKSGMEGNQTHFGRFFIDAFKENAADSDKNSRVSIVEAFSYASRKVEEYYKNEGSLQTEHPVLDDNGDGEGAGSPGPENGEGLLARVTFLDQGPLTATRPDLTAEQQNLAREARELEAQIDALKYEKEKMPEAEYENKLEELLIRLARINARLPK